MEDPKSGASTGLVVLPQCRSCGHPACEHAGPGMKCRICGDRYTDPAEDDPPSSLLWGE
jgi:hypothetical protein